MPFTEWITGKYQDWRGGKTGRKGGISEYARWLGLSQQVVNGWINDGSVPDRKKSIDALVARYGYEVYEILGIDPPVELPSPEDATFADWIRLLKQLPEKDREELLASARARLREQMQESEQAPDQVEEREGE